jgi:hypothetical protein
MPPLLPVFFLFIFSTWYLPSSMMTRCQVWPPIKRAPSSSKTCKLDDCNSTAVVVVWANMQHAHRHMFPWMKDRLCGDSAIDSYITTRSGCKYRVDMEACTSCMGRSSVQTLTSMVALFIACMSVVSLWPPRWLSHSYTIFAHQRYLLPVVDFLLVSPMLLPLAL